MTATPTPGDLSARLQQTARDYCQGSGGEDADVGAQGEDLNAANAAIVDEIRALVGLTGKPGSVVEAVRALATPAAGKGVDEAAALAEFTRYFVKNYPGPDTIICDPNWHAPRIFRAAQAALTRQPVAGDGWLPIETAPAGVWVLTAIQTATHSGVAVASKRANGQWMHRYGGAFGGWTHWMPLPAAPAATPTDGGEG